MNEAPAARPYRDPWYAKNRLRVIERQRRRYANAVQRLTPKELAECCRDPRKAWKVRGPAWIACLDCGELHEQLGHHLRIRHKLTAAAYKAEAGPDGIPRLSKNASLLCLDLQERLSKTRRKLKLGRRLQRSGKVPPVRKLIASRGKRILSQEYRSEQGERMRRGRPELWGKQWGNPIGKRAEDWEIARQAADGISDDAIAKSLGISHGESIGARRRKIGFSAGPKKARAYYHGRPLVGRDLRNACEDLNLTRQALADHMGLRYKTVQDRASRKRVDQPLPTMMGREFKAAYVKLREEYRHRAQGPDGGRPSLLLPYERAAIRTEYEVLLSPVKAFLKWTQNQRDNGAAPTFERIREYIYLEARRGRLRELALWPEFLEWLDQNPNSLSLKPFTLTYEFLARAYRVKVGSIRKSLENS
jgi:hypothetical protein